MRRTTIVGYPRIGSQRELKFWTQSYFRRMISADTLQENAAALRKEQWLCQKKHGIDMIPSNDFSFYDGMLDTILMLNAIPKAYRNLGLNEMDTYFAMAHGYQGERGDVKALAMRKWFNTNYHYMVPELSGSMQLRLNSNKLFHEYNEALALGIQTRPVVIGPFTFLMLADCDGDVFKKSSAQDVLEAYCELLEKFDAAGGEWLQMDEPSLVTDLSKEDIDLFVSLYTKILTHKGNLKILLQTYFGDIRDAYSGVVSLGFDGIGLDFVEGKQTMDLIQSNGFPTNTLLFAGIVNGKNIWRNSYAKTLALLDKLKAAVSGDHIVLSTSCSLLHTPYTVAKETAMDEKYKRHFAFAEEKLSELRDLKALFGDPDYGESPVYKVNASLIQIRKSNADAQVRNTVAALTEDDFTRKPDFEQRRAIQKEALALPVLPTTTIGSFPQTSDVKALRTKLKKGEISLDEYKNRIKKKIADCIALQEDIGLDVLVHGEYERNDMVEYFGENFDGYLFTQNAWVQSYGTRCVKPPIIWGDVKRNKPITVEYIEYAQSLTGKPVKGMLTGPVTILNWSFPREDVSNREMAFQIALALKEEVADLEKSGIRIIQIDEAALKEKLPIRRADWYVDYLDWAIPAFRLVHCGVKPSTQIHTHMCYSEFGDIIRDIDAMDADVISFEAARSHFSIVDSLVSAHFSTAVGPGVYDIHSPRVPSCQEIEEAISSAVEKLGSQKLWVNPDCGLKTRGEAETVPSLKHMVEAAKTVRDTL